MPYEIRFDSPPAGYALDSATGEGSRVRVVFREFTSTEDGELFVSRLEGFPNQILSMLPPHPDRTPSRIDHLLAIIQPDLSAMVYINECDLLLRIRAARAIKAGEPVFEDDIADIESLQFRDVKLPADAAVLCVVSAGWRKGLFFDFAPLGPGAPQREYDLEKLLGSYYAYLTNQGVFRLDEGAWHNLLGQQWFPFVSLRKALVKRMVASARAGTQIDQLLPEIAEAVTAKAPDLPIRWSTSEILGPHHELLRHAVDKFLQRDYISTTAILYPRIEGILRSIHEMLKVPEKPTQKVLSRSAVESRSQELNVHSWLLPKMFQKYLEEVYFANFEPGKDAPLSRHSVGHGVAAATDFNQKAACIALLVVDQLFYLIPSKKA